MNLLKGVNVYLIGMMGAGKTTVGKWLASELGYRFFDTDILIEQVAGKSVSEIFTRDGEESFRELESKVLQELSAYTNLIVATGGGIVLRQINWSYLHHGVVVWLNVPVEEICDRLREDNSRPLLREGDPKIILEGIFTQRQRFYAQADVQVFAGGDNPEIVGMRVIEELQKMVKVKEERKLKELQN
ncbi:shikimate kinase [Oscillatoriales cyanobacterium USR001]|nr:shikimate kinase [Oscillatoriales cyanobacterium USR001]